MPITPNRGRQGLIDAFVEFTFTDVTPGAGYNAIELPPGAIVTGGDLVVITAFDTSGTATVAIGDVTTNNRYLTATSVKTAGRTPLVPTGFKTTPTQRWIRVTSALSTTDATVGQCRLRVTYIVDKRMAFSQG